MQVVREASAPSFDIVEKVDPNLLAAERRALVYAKEIGEALHTKYPGHLWSVTPSADFSMLAVKNLNLSSRYGFYVPLAGKEALPLYATRRKAMLIGGEILERHNIDRGRGGLEQAKSVMRDRKGVFEVAHERS